jgi:hypothetical protein
VRDAAMVDMQYVQSSSIEQVGYDSAAHELHIVFKDSGAYYIYFAVPSEVYEEFVNASSLGNYFNRQIKRVYDYRKE